MSKIEQFIIPGCESEVNKMNKNKKKPVVVMTEDGVRLLPLIEAAELVGVSRQRVYSLIRAGKVRSVEVGNYVFVDFDSLRDWACSETRFKHAMGRYRDKLEVV